jgi:hypothetical protein
VYDSCGGMSWQLDHVPDQLLVGDLLIHLPWLPSYRAVTAPRRVGTLLRSFPRTGRL